MCKLCETYTLRKWEKMIKISEWDTKHFGFKIAKMGEEELQPALDECADLGVKLLICRCNAENLSFLHQLEKKGFGLMDGLVYYRLRVGDTPWTSHLIRPCLPCEAKEVATIAKEVYTDFIGHFHQDPMLGKAKCDDLYVKWARHACLDKKVAEIMLVAEVDGKIVGFDSHEIINGDTGFGVISGVSKEFQGKGIRTALLFAGMNWCVSQGLEYMEADVHINHYIMHRVYSNHGFKIYKSEYTFHKWF